MTLLLAAAALAESTADANVALASPLGPGTGGTYPTISAQRMHASIEGMSLWADDSTVGATGPFAGRALVSYAWRPLIYVSEEGAVSDLVGNLVQLDLLAGYALGPVRVGLDVPVYLRSFGGLGTDQTGLGDLAVDVKIGILDRNRHPLGLALATREYIPSSNTDGLSNGGFGWEATLILDGRIGPSLLAVNAGARVLPDATLENAVWSSAVLARVAWALPVGEKAGITADVNADVGLGGTLWDGSASDFIATAPAEALGGGWVRAGAVVFRGAAGAAITPGIGAPSARLILGLSFEPIPVQDTDGDGLLDDSDGCITRPEDNDLVDDTDGCPEPTDLVVRFVDSTTGLPIVGVVSGLAGREGIGDRALALPADRYALVANAPGYETLRTMIEVSPGRPVGLIVPMKREVAMGRLVLVVVDETGTPLAATLAMPGAGVDRPTARFDRMVPAGEFDVVVTAPGYQAVSQHILLPSGGDVQLTLTMRPESVSGPVRMR